MKGLGVCGFSVYKKPLCWNLLSPLHPILSLFSFSLQHSLSPKQQHTHWERGEFNFLQWRFLLLLQQNGSSSCFWRCLFEKKLWLHHRSLTSGWDTRTNSVSVSKAFFFFVFCVEFVFFCFFELHCGVFCFCFKWGLRVIYIHCFGHITWQSGISKMKSSF